MADDPREPRTGGGRDDAAGDQTLPGVPPEGTRDGAREPGTWSARASVPAARPVPQGPAPTQWEQVPAGDGGRWWMPIVAGLVAMLLLGVLGLAIWLIGTAADDQPGPSTPSATATRRASPTPSKPAPTTAPARVEVPELTGVTLEEAQDRLERLGLKYRVRFQPDEAEPGTILWTDPEAGSMVARDRRVLLVVARPPVSTTTPEASPPAAPTGGG